MTARKKLSAGTLATGYPSKRDEAVLNAGGTRCESALYDFAVDGGAVGTINLGRNLPAGAIVTDVYFDVLTAATSGGLADFKLTAGSTDIMAATDFDDATDGVDAAGLKKLSALNGSAAAIKISTESELQLDIVTAALTAGKIRFLVKYLLPND